MILVIRLILLAADKRVRCLQIRPCIPWRIRQRQHLSHDHGSHSLIVWRQRVVPDQRIDLPGIVQTPDIRTHIAKVDDIDQRVSHIGHLSQLLIDIIALKQHPHHSGEIPLRLHTVHTIQDIVHALHAQTVDTVQIALHDTQIVSHRIQRLAVEPVLRVVQRRTHLGEGIGLGPVDQRHRYAEKRIPLSVHGQAVQPVTQSINAMAPVISNNSTTAPVQRQRGDTY